MRNWLTAEDINIINDIFVALWFISSGSCLLFGDRFGPRLDKFFSNSFKRFFIFHDHLLFLFFGIFIQGLGDRGPGGFFGHSSSGSSLIFVLVKRGLGGPVIAINPQSAFVVCRCAGKPSRLVRLVINTAVLGSSTEAGLLIVEPTVVAAAHHSTHSFSNSLRLESFFFQHLFVAQQIDDHLGPFSNSLTPVNALVVVREVVERTELVNVVLEG
jgi:hypothetical protein